MIKKYFPALLAAGFLTTSLFGQGLDTKASKNDWEEINFEFNSAVLTDGYPSLLRIADILKNHPEYKVKIVGNTDSIGSNRYNDRLAVQRANTVAQFLQKYGASASQISASGNGKRDPEAPNGNKLGRWVNRRVVLTVTDANGNVISDGQQGDGSINKTILDLLNDINRKLDKLSRLDDIIAQLDALKNQVAAIKGDTGQIITTTNSIKSDTTNLVARPSPLTYEQTQQIARSAADYALEQTAIRNKKYSVVGANVGPTFMPGRTGNFTATGIGKALIPFGNGKTPDQSGTHAVQIGATYYYWPGHQDTQFDAGFLERFKFVQAGFFGSFMYGNSREYGGGATLGSASLVIDFPFKDGKIGIWGSHGFKSTGILSRSIEPIPGLVGLPNAFYRTENAIGVDATVGLWGESYLVANAGYKKSIARGLSDRPIGSLKIVLPLTDLFAFTAEAGVNQTFQNTHDDGRVVFGFEFGNWLKPKHYNDTTAPVPTEVPAIHYELLRR